MTTFEAQLGQIATQLEIARLTMSHSISRSNYSKQIFKTSLQQRADVLRQRLAALRSKLLNGTADTQEIEALYAAIDALNFEASVVSSVGQLGDAFATLDKLEDSNWVLFSEGLTAGIGEVSADNRIGRLERSRRIAFGLRGDLQTIHSKWLKVQSQAVSLAEALEAGGVTDAADRAAALVAPQLAIIKSDLAKIGSDEKIQTFLRDAYDQVKSAERRALIVQIATMIGIAVVSNGLASAAEGVAIGWGASAMGAQIVGVTVETTTFTLLNARLSGEPFLHAFVSNFVGNMLTFGAMRAVNAKISGSVIGRTLARAKAGERVAVLAKFAAKLGAITAPAMVAIGVQFAQAEYESLLQTGKTMSMADLQIAGVQGIAMMVGAAVSHRVLGDGIQEAKALGIRAGAHLERRARIQALAEAVMQSGDPSAAMDLLHEAREHLEREAAELEELGEMSDKTLESKGMSRPVVEALANRNQRNMAALDGLDAGTMSAQLGLDTVVPGQVYAGDRAAVQRVTDHYRARGYRVELDGATHRVTSPDGKSFHIIEREVAVPGSSASKGPIATKNVIDPGTREGKSKTVAGANNAEASTHAAEEKDAESKAPISEVPATAAAPTKPPPTDAAPKTPTTEASAAPSAGGEKTAKGAQSQEAQITQTVKSPAPPARVSEPVPGLYDSVDPKVQPIGWVIHDSPPKRDPSTGRITYRTQVMAPDGSQGWIERSYDPKTGTLLMENAFLNGLPKWIDVGVPMAPGKGTPTVTYLTLRQMKQMNVPLGGLKKVKMSTIQNIEAVMQLDQMLRNGIPLDQAIAQTHSVKYATTSIEQSGHTVGKIEADMTNSFPWELDEMMDHFQMPAAERQALFAKYGLGPSDSVIVNYDILIDVAPHPNNP